RTDRVVGRPEDGVERRSVLGKAGPARVGAVLVRGAVGQFVVVPDADRGGERGAAVGGAGHQHLVAVLGAGVGVVEVGVHHVQGSVRRGERLGELVGVAGT